MTSSYRRVLFVTLATAALLGLSVAGAGAAGAASGIQAGAVHSGSGNGNGNGNNGGSGGNGNGAGHGQGTATPELPSGVLFGLGLAPLAAGLFLVWRRRRPEPV